YFFFSSRRRHTRFSRDWSSDVCSSDLHFKGRKRTSGNPTCPKQQYFRSFKVRTVSSLHASRKPSCCTESVCESVYKQKRWYSLRGRQGTSCPAQRKGLPNLVT